MPRALLCVLFASSLLTVTSAARSESSPFFAIQVLDEATGRGVPLVRLETTDKACYYTDSNGYVAFNEPGLMGEDVWFGVSSYGYEFPHESFGFRGVALKVTPGGRARSRSAESISSNVSTASRAMASTATRSSWARSRRSSTAHLTPR